MSFCAINMHGGEVSPHCRNMCFKHGIAWIRHHSSRQNTTSEYQCYMSCHKSTIQSILWCEIMRWIATLLGPNISPFKCILSRWFSELPQVGYVSVPGYRVPLWGTSCHLGMEPLGHVIRRSVSNLEGSSCLIRWKETRLVKKHCQKKIKAYHV